MTVLLWQKRVGSGLLEEGRCTLVDLCWIKSDYAGEIVFKKAFLISVELLGCQTCKGIDLERCMIHVVLNCTSIVVLLSVEMGINEID